MVDDAGTTAYAYTAGNQLFTEDGPFASDTVTNLYLNRMRTNLVLAQPTLLWTNLFRYDAARRLTNVTSPGGSFTNEYFAGVGGQSGFSSQLVKRLLLPNTSIITNDFDSVARLLGTYLRTSNGTLTNKHEYVYNAASQRMTTTRTDASTVAYTYDRIGQVTIADSSVNSEDRGYYYDTAWNLNRRTNNGVTSTFAVDNKNQLTNAFNTALGYDDNGNLTSSNGTHKVYTYDDENRLTSWASYVNSSSSPVNGDWLTGFTYDGLGRLRIRKEYKYVNIGETPDPNWVLQTETHYVYDGKRVIQERDGSNVPTVSYTRGNDLSGSLEGAGGIGGLLGRSHGYSSGNWTTHSVYHADGNGNVTFMLNSSQSVVANYRYDPFGNLISSSGSLTSANVYRFSSKEIHVKSGMYYYLYRWYEPNLQRWINRDPIAEFGGINLYAFVANGPTHRFDIDGYTWRPGPPGSKPPKDENSVICKGGKPVPSMAKESPQNLVGLYPNDQNQIQGYLCAQKCARDHENCHIKDILDQNPDVCKGVADGTPVINDDPNGELEVSEQKCHKQEADCLKDCTIKCPGSSAVTGKQEKNDQWLKEHEFQ